MFNGVERCDLPVGVAETFVTGRPAGFHAGPASPHNHAQTVRNLKHSLRKAATGARLIQADGLDSKSAAELAASLADALDELHRLKRSLDRRIRRDQRRSNEPTN